MVPQITDIDVQQDSLFHWTADMNASKWWLSAYKQGTHQQ